MKDTAVAPKPRMNLALSYFKARDLGQWAFFLVITVNF
jgi:hypothetical protein